ncbi:MAG: hypothetical protein K5790_03065 [Nitrosopumilus sp.]|uniref:hypothetical protein n=1 Tax=Nitrosopumilus sp. TaxID=2024843 RepID=UPI00247BEFE5|nr:hypothetical protein [Nitrosopumilus sp.]MCV0392257.1 hypothetical protein [Nitrosopumilus sp.]
MQSTESSDKQSDVNAPETTEPQVLAETSVAVDPTDVNAKTLTHLNTLMEESLQIYELEDQKTTVIGDLHNALKVITSFLSFSTSVHPGIFNLPTDSRVTMLPDLKLILTLSNGKTEIKKFTDYDPEVITQIVEYVTPQLLELIKAQKAYLAEKITFLRTATKQLSTLNQLKENIPTIINTDEE